MTGEHLKKRLDSTRISYSELAKGIGLSRSGLCNKFGNYSISTELIEHLADFLQVPITWFWEGTKYEVVEEKKDNTSLEEIVKRYGDMLDRKDEQIDKLLAFLGK
jgi:transcriptional regulator with XRE-family HTH domain